MFSTRQRIEEILVVLVENVHSDYPFPIVERRNKKKEKKGKRENFSPGIRKPDNFLYKNSKKKEQNSIEGA